MEDIQKLWKLPCIAQFTSLFRNPFKFPEMDIEELEESFVIGDSPHLYRIIIPLLQSCCKMKKIGLENWESFLQQFLEKKYRREGRKNPITHSRRFSSLPIRIKVDIVYSLCHYRLDCKDVEPIMKAMEPDALRVQSLGCDNHGNVYWYFYGTRLYKEEPTAQRRKNWEEEWNQQKGVSQLKKKRGRPKKVADADMSERQNGQKRRGLNLDSKSRWSVVCASLNDWEVFAQKFKDSKTKNEVSLYKLVTKNFLPALSDLYIEKEKRLQRKLQEFSSSPEPMTPKAATPQQDDSCDYASQSNGDETSETDDRPPKRTRTHTGRTAGRETGRRNSRESSNESLPRKQPSLSEPFYERDFVKQLSDIDINQKPETFTQLRQVMTKVKLHKDSWPFLNAVDEGIAPGYYDIVKDPIDLSAIERKLHLNAYHSLIQVDRDFLKMVFNCRQYNGSKSDYTTMAKNLLNVFRENLAQELGLSKTVQKQSDSPVSKKVHHNSTLLRARCPPQVVRHKTKYGRKKKVTSSSMQGLEMLAEASEQALKETNLSETEVSTPKRRGRQCKAKSFPDLKIIPIQSHSSFFLERFSANPNSSDSESHQLPSPERRISYPLNASDQLAAVEYDNGPENFGVLNDGYVSPDSCNVIYNNLESDGDCPEIPDLTRNFDELSDCNDLDGEAAKNDALTSLSSLLCKIIKDNQDFDIADEQDVSYEDNNDSILSNDLSRPSSPSGGKSKISPNTDHPDEYDEMPPRLTSNQSFGSIRSLNDITTVDASVLGLSSTNSLSPESNSMVKDSACETVSPKYRAKINGQGFLHEVNSSDELSPQKVLERPATSNSSPACSYSIGEDKHLMGQSVAASEDVPKSNSFSPDSQLQELTLASNNVESLVNAHPRLSPTYGFIPGQAVSNLTQCPVQIPNSGFVPPMSSSILSNLLHDKDNCLSKPLPLQVPVPNAMMPLFMNQNGGFPLTSANGQITFVPSSSQQVVRPIAAFPFAHHSPSNSPPSSTTQLLNNSPSSHTSPSTAKVSCDVKSDSPKGKKRKRNVAPKHHQPPISSQTDACHFNGTLGSVVDSGGDKLPTLRQYTDGICSPPDKVSSSADTSRNSIIESRSPPDLTMNSASMPLTIESKNSFTLPVYSSYNPSVTNDGRFWNGMDNRPVQAIPVTHHLPLHSLFATQSQAAATVTSSSYAGVNMNQRLPMTTNALALGRGFESLNTMAQPLQNASHRSIAPNVMPNPMFPNFPVLYAMPSTTSNSLFSSSTGDLNAIMTQKNLQGVKVAESNITGSPAYVLQGLPARPMQNFNNIANQQLRHPSYLNMPFMMPHQSNMPTIVPNGSAHGGDELVQDPANATVPTKSVPVYAVLQNVPRSR